MKRAYTAVALLLCAVFIIVLFLPSHQNATMQTPSAADSISSIDEQQPQIQQGLRAVWFSYLDWQKMLCQLDETLFIQRTAQICKTVRSAGFNALILQLRAFGDAMYPSTLFPMSKTCAGAVGATLAYDPLALFLQQAKEQGLQIHGWINPMRTMSDEEFALVNDDNTLKQWRQTDYADHYVRDQQGRSILNPANPEVRAFICKGADELMRQYDLAGLHIDDYFYPVGIDELPDNDQSYYASVGPDASIQDWRRAATSEMVRELYQTVHDAKPDAVFGVSPQANLQNDYNKLYIDVAAWVSQPGYVDYIMPQLYFGFNNSAKPFAETAAEWSALIKTDIDFYAGLAAYKLGMENDANAGSGSGEWAEVAASGQDMLKRQEECLRQLPHYNGYCLYAYQSLFDQNGGATPATAAEMQNLNSLF